MSKINYFTSFGKPRFDCRETLHFNYQILNFLFISTKIQNLILIDNTHKPLFKRGIYGDRPKLLIGENTCQPFIKVTDRENV